MVLPSCMASDTPDNNNNKNTKRRGRRSVILLSRFHHTTVADHNGLFGLFVILGIAVQRCYTCHHLETFHDLQRSKFNAHSSSTCEQRWFYHCAAAASATHPGEAHMLPVQVRECPERDKELT